MNIIEIIIVSLSVAIDAFVASIAKGILANKKIDALKVGLCFGLFQFFMPKIGFILSYKISSIVFKYNHYIAFLILFYLGINSIKKKDDKDSSNLFILAIATSIDAFSIGIAYSCGYGMHNSNLTFIMMGLVTFVLSYIGVLIGYKIPLEKFSNSNILVGIVFIALGIKQLLLKI